MKNPTALTALICLVLSLGGAALAAEPAWQTEVDEALPTLLETYRHLHAHPELSYQEEATAAVLAAELRELGFEVTERVGDYGVEGRISYGVVGILANGPGPTVMLRTDLDGLPIAEDTGLPFASRATGLGDGGEAVPVMHACGHDLHMTSWLGAARLLSGLKDSWQGTLMMVGQPAEERGAGARAMLDGGLFRRFSRPDYALALHVSPELAAGTLGVVPGYALANVDSVDITVRGRGSHGAYPHESKDPVTLAAQIITNLQSIVSRRVSPFDPAVVTVGSIHGGSKHNIIPAEVRLQLTVRSYKPEVRRLLLDGIREVALGTARAAGFPEELMPEVAVREEEFTPSTFNDPELARRLTEVWSGALGEGMVVEALQVMAGEDFSRYGLDGEIPIQIFWLGTVSPQAIGSAASGEASLPPLHSPFFRPEAESALRTGVTAMTAAALELFGE